MIDDRLSRELAMYFRKLCHDIKVANNAKPVLLMTSATYDALEYLIRDEIQRSCIEYHLYDNIGEEYDDVIWVVPQSEYNRITMGDFSRGEL